MIEDWALRGMQRWPNVPALFGWLGLDRRGRWLIRGEPITRPQIVETINRNYTADEHGRWYFQNGPQRGYVSLAYAPFVLRLSDDLAGLQAHTGAPVSRLNAAWIDQEGSLVFDTDIGPGLLLDADLPWALEHLACGGAPVGSEALADALTVPSGAATGLTLTWRGVGIPLHRSDAEALPLRLGYCRDPRPVLAQAAAVN